MEIGKFARQLRLDLNPKLRTPVGYMRMVELLAAAYQFKSFAALHAKITTSGSIENRPPCLNSIRARAVKIGIEDMGDLATIVAEIDDRLREVDQCLMIPTRTVTGKETCISIVRKVEE